MSTPSKSASDPWNRSGSDAGSRRLEICLWLFCAGIGLLQAWLYRYVMSIDGLTYLEIGQDYFRGDWKAALNSYWSPGYCWLLGLGLALLQPRPETEAVVAHGITFVTYLGAMFGFSLFIREFILWMESPNAAGEYSLHARVPRSTWILLGYSLFMWSSLNVATGFWLLYPDIGETGFIYLAAALTLRIRRGHATWRNFCLLGGALGLGYLVKTPMFLMAFVFFGMNAVLVRHARALWPRLLAGVLVFCLLTGPFVAAISMQKGRLTFGESARINYAWFVNQTKIWVHWQGEDGQGGIPKHPTRQIHRSPAIFEFAQPIGGFYPPVRDPSYWYEGVRPHFDPKRQLVILLRGLQCYLNYLFLEHSALGAVMLILLCLVPAGHRLAGLVKSQWPLWIPAASALLLFGLVRADGRYIAGYVVLFCLAFFTGLRVPDNDGNRRWMGASLTGLALITLLLVSYPIIRSSGLAWFRPETLNTTALWHARIAADLRQLGLQPGDQVGCIGYPDTEYWAHLAQVRIVAELPLTEADLFWKAGAREKSAMLDLFRNAGAKMVVTACPPACAETEGWKRIGTTDHYFYALTPGR